MQLFALLRLAFATVAPPQRVNLATPNNSPDHYAKGTRLGIPVSCETGIALPLVVGTWFQILFHSPLGVLFTFPSRY